MREGVATGCDKAAREEGSTVASCDVAGILPSLEYQRCKAACLVTAIVIREGVYIFSKTGNVGLRSEKFQESAKAADVILHSWFVADRINFLFHFWPCPSLCCAAPFSTRRFESETQRMASNFAEVDILELDPPSGAEKKVADEARKAKNDGAEDLEKNKEVIGYFREVRIVRALLSTQLT